MFVLDKLAGWKGGRYVAHSFPASVPLSVPRVQASNPVAVSLELLVYPVTDGLLLSSQPFLGLRDVTSDLLAGRPTVLQDASQRETPVAGRFGIDLVQPDAARGVVLVVVVAASAEVTFLMKRHVGDSW